MNAKSEITKARNLHKPVANIAPGLTTKATIVVVGAGAFGGWTSLWLLRKGFKVINVDLWGPGNASSSSGGETRLLRCVYGIGNLYARLAARSLELWLENEKILDKQLFVPSGALWFINDSYDGGFVEASLQALDALKLSYERLTPTEAGKRYPALHVSDLSGLVLEKKAGYLLAREACISVTKRFIAEGGTYVQSEALPGVISNGRLNNLLLKNEKLEGDAYVFACGPWMPEIFPELLGNKIIVSRQEVFYFGMPSGLVSSFEDHLPPWLDLDREHMYYGFPQTQHRGFKIAAHGKGKIFNPTCEDRIVSGDELEKARNYLAFRFPVLKHVPLVESRVCQYSNTPDEHFIMDQHPEAANVWLLGGGSGHGFKHGPALGELAAAAIAGESSVPDEFSLKRFDLYNRQPPV